MGELGLAGVGRSRVFGGDRVLGGGMIGRSQVSLDDQRDITRHTRAQGGGRVHSSGTRRCASGARSCAQRGRALRARRIARASHLWHLGCTHMVRCEHVVRGRAALARRGAACEQHGHARSAGAHCEIAGSVARSSSGQCDAVARLSQPGFGYRQEC